MGDGWYADGANDQRDYYIPFAMHYYGLIYAKLAGDGDPERAQRFRRRAAAFAQEFIHWFAADGAALPFGRSLTYRFAQGGFWGALAFTDGRLDLFQSEKVQRIVAFPQAISLGGDAFVNYSDAAERVTIHAGLGSYLRARFQQPVPALGHPSFHTDPIYRWGNVTRDLLWTDAAFGQTAVADGSVYLPDIAWVVDRRVIAGKTIAFSAKGGHNDEPHNHNDLGHFILHVGGESLLADLGAGVYTRRYFGPERYEALHTGSQGHSVPVINGVGQGNACTEHGRSGRPSPPPFSITNPNPMASALPLT